ncbi:MAG: ATP-binding protein, partial [Pseudomonadota bacterium]
RRYEELETEQERADLFDASLNTMDVSIRFAPGETVPRENKLSPFNPYNAVFERRLDDKVGRPFWLNTQSWQAYVEVRVQVEDGVLVFFALRDRVFATTGQAFIFWLIGTSLLLGSIAIIFLRNQVRSILRLAKAAEAFGRGRDAPDFRPTGATEVRQAGRAFIAMRERIKRQIDQRTTMLAGVSHDLRTPLTRLKLALALDPTSSDLQAMRQDVSEMESMINAYLDFAADAAASEAPCLIDLTELARDAASAANNTVDATPVEFIDSQPIKIEGRLTSLKRAIDNLIVNGQKYANHVWVTVNHDAPHAEIIIDDNGPGIPMDKREAAFRPFYRIDEARSDVTSGVGLGLTIVRDAARSHGGDALFSDSPYGGLRAVIRVPT